MRKPPEDATLLEHFAVAYGRVHMARRALEAGVSRYDERHWWLGQRFRRRYLAGTMSMSSLGREEQPKMQRGSTCCYCGSGETKVTLEHVIPLARGGLDLPKNLMPACRSCNSSKRHQDMVLWMDGRGQFPPIVVLNRYLKLAAEWCEHSDQMTTKWTEVDDAAWPFDKRSLRVSWPRHPEDLCLWPEPD